MWREFGKFQTFNPFETGCKCTSVQYFPAPANQFETKCSKWGLPIALNATLLPNATAGAGVFSEQFASFLPRNRLAIVDQGTLSTGEEYLVEFDCSVTFGVLSYCYHAFTASGTASAALVAYVQKFAAVQGLNPHNLTWAVTDQQNCD